MKREPFSVLVSLYEKENPQYLVQCLESLLRQTYRPNEIVLVKDGPLTKELEDVLLTYIQAYPEVFVIVPIKKNVGLGLALAKGLKHCKYDLVARMDADDIAVKTRFEKQIKAFARNPSLHICGGQIAEFEKTPDRIVARRKVPLQDAAIKKYQKRRDAFNHVTVMFRKEKVLEAGNYQSALLMEDTLLWANMIMHGALCKNLPDDLVYVRIGEEMYKRRGGLTYFMKYQQGRKKVRETGFIGWYDYCITVGIQLLVALLPSAIRGVLFKKVLHK